LNGIARCRRRRAIASRVPQDSFFAAKPVVAEKTQQTDANLRIILIVTPFL
jgi:hypothetical protein